VTKVRDLDALLAADLEANGPGSRCTVWLAIHDNTIPAEHREWIAAQVAGTAKAASISRTLRHVGIDIGAHSINRHRNRKCKCQPS
jgi:hypothetical protein